MRTHTYFVTLSNGSRHLVTGENKKSIADKLNHMTADVVGIERIYKTGIRAVAPF